MCFLGVESFVGLDNLEPDQMNKLLSQDTETGASTLCTNFDVNRMCRKNTGAGERGYNYSRGYVFIVRASGIVDYFAPIYRQVPLCSDIAKHAKIQCFSELRDWVRFFLF